MKNTVLYAPTHEWVKVEGNTAKVGISSYAAMHLGDIVFFDLPTVGEEIAKEQGFGSVESVKSASELYLPVTGKVVAVNEALVNQPELVGEDPYENWIIEIELTNPAELETLMNVEAYEATL